MQEPGKSPEESTLLGERREIVRSALAELSDDQRVLIQAAYFEGLTQTEIAERFHLPLGTVKTRVRSGMIILRAHWVTTLNSFKGMLDCDRQLK
jgi:RNA polymerase sigma-70 factor (ECF subfamily)